MSPVLEKGKSHVSGMGRSEHQVCTMVPFMGHIPHGHPVKQTQSLSDVQMRPPGLRDLNNWMIQI